MADKIFIGIDDQKIEAKGAQLEYVLQAQADGQAEVDRIEQEQLAKRVARESVLIKLQALGFTAEEVQVAFGLEQ
jgi:hypothetical protein